jgi:hypothetical protein
MKSTAAEVLDLLGKYFELWPGAPNPAPEAFDAPNLGAELLRRAIERGRPLTEEEIQAAFPDRWTPDKDYLL